MKISRAMIEQILSMHKQGVSIRKISLALNLSRNMIRSYLRDSLPKPQTEKSEAQASAPDRWDFNFPWDKAIGLYKRGVTQKQIYEELTPAISYSRFFKVLRAKCKP